MLDNVLSAESAFHDINNQLAAINLNLSLLEAGLDYEQIAVRSSLSMLKDVRSSLSQLKTVDFKAGPAAEQVVDSQLEIKEVVQLFLYRCRYSQIELIQDMEAGAIIRGDALHFRRIVVNLLQNAIEALERKSMSVGKRIQLKTYKSGRTLYLVVSDNGMGMDASQVKELSNGGFTSKFEPGHGIGIKYVRMALAHVFKGEFTINSEAGIGTEVTATFRLI